MHILWRTGNGAIDALFGQQNDAFNLVCLTERQQRRSALRKVRKVYKFIKRCCQINGVGGSLCHASNLL